MRATIQETEKHSPAARPALPSPHGHTTRFWLFVLLLFAAGAAIAALFVQYKLETLRASLLEAAKTMTGAELAFRAVTVSGLRGLTVSDLRVTLDSGDGVRVAAQVPNVKVFIDVVDLLYGDVTIDRIQLDEAKIEIERELGARWSLPTDTAVDKSLQLGTFGGFRLVGENCKLLCSNVVGESDLVLDDLTFDVARLPGAEHVDARASAAINSQEERVVDVHATFSAPDDFSVRATCTELSAEDINIFLPASQHFVTQGVTKPNIRVDAYPGSNLVLFSLTAPIESVALRDQPGFLEPSASGNLTLLANYDFSTSQLTFLTAKADSAQLKGALEGTISFADEVPSFDLHLEASRFPVEGLVGYALSRRTDDLGELAVTLQEPCSITVTLRGTPEQPDFSGGIHAAGAAVGFVPADKSLPKMDVRLGASQLTWAGNTQAPSGEFTILDGEVEIPKTKLVAKRLAGLGRVADGKVAFETINADVTGHPCVGSVSYDWASRSGTFSIAGNLTTIEKTPLSTAIEDTVLSGAASVNCTGEFSTKSVVVSGDVDATHTQIEHEWWFKKPAGVGATGRVALKFTPNSSAEIKITDAEVAASQLEAAITFSKLKAGWLTETATVKSSHLDVITVGKCLQIPYVLTGTHATDGYFQWDRVDNRKFFSNLSMGCKINELSALPAGGEVPVKVKDADVRVEMTRRLDDREGTIAVKGAAASLPRLGTSWFLPLRPPEELREKFPPEPRQWRYKVELASLDLPPWIGTDFLGEGHFGLSETALEHYRAKVGGGNITGSYSVTTPENTYTTRAVWEGVPSTQFIDYLRLPPLLNGPMDGEVTYSADRDDPGSRTGSGYFRIANGQFSADYLIPWIEGKMDEPIAVVPGWLRFSELTSKLEFERDQVKTPDLTLKSEGIQILANGYFITDGDMDYELQVSLAPDTAERIDTLKDYINIQGHRLAQQNIDLAFRVTGPTFNPVGELSKSPGASVTLISGALEVTSEAIQVIDLPRRLLLDLLRVGGGIVRPTS